MEEKRQQLLEHKAAIERELEGRDPWFFPSQDGVDGYMGTGPVMFVGQRPSTGGGELGGRGPSAVAFQAFYASLKRHGFENAHLTDLVKERKKVGALSREELDRNWPFFENELSVVKPVVVVALGGDVLEPLVRRIDRIVPFWRVTHYAYRYRKGSRIGQQFDRDIQRLAEVLKKTGLWAA